MSQKKKSDLGDAGLPARAPTPVAIAPSLKTATKGLRIPIAPPHKPLKFRMWIGKNRRMYTGIVEVMNCMMRQMAFDMKLVLSDDNRFPLDYVGTMNTHFMQFTGKYDRNGKEIYEGDVVAVYPERKYHGKESRFWVDWIDTLWGQEYQWRHISGYECSTHIMEDDEFNTITNAEVIGNIHENPELIAKAEP